MHKRFPGRAAALMAAALIAASAAQAAGITKVKEIRDPLIRSPKSVLFNAAGDFWVNSLEGGKTALFDGQTLAPKASVSHRFTAGDRELFRGEDTLFDYRYPVDSPCRNCFMGKPVESVLTHGGRYLWVTYYRRSYDPYAQDPSAAGVIDTRTNALVRVMPTGPLPKMVSVSPDGKTLAVTHWGDNTVALADISGERPGDFRWSSLITVGQRLSMDSLTGKSRDNDCGSCLRGTVFSPDGRHLFVARMHDGGIAVLDVAARKVLHVAFPGIEKPRHLITGGDYLYASSRDGVWRIPLAEAVGNGSSAEYLPLGPAVRTIVLSPDGGTLFAVSNYDSMVRSVSLKEWRVTAEAPVPNFAVGLDVSPDGRTLAVTSQGKAGFGGGDVVTVYRWEP